MQPNDNGTDHPEQSSKAGNVPPVLEAVEGDRVEPEPNANAENGKEQAESGARSPGAAAVERKLLVSLRSWLKWSNGVVAIATVATVFISYWQFQALQDANEAATKAADAAVSASATAQKALSDNREYFTSTLDLMRAQTQATIDAARASKESAASAAAQANAATKANELSEAGQREARASLREDQRARLVLSIQISQRPTEAAPKLGIRMPLTITGSTDATRVRFTHVNAFIPAGERRAYPDWTNPGLKWSGIDVIIAGQQGRFLSAEVEVQPATLTAYLAGERNALMMTRVEYCDAFQRRHFYVQCAEHSTRRNQITYCGAQTDDNDGTETQPECR